MSSEEYEVLVELDKNGQIASWALTALEFIGLFAASKAIAQMWSLFLVIQMVAFMIKWQI